MSNNKKRLRESNSGRTDHKPELYPLYYEVIKLHVAVDKILLIKTMSFRLVVSHFVMMCYSTLCIMPTVFYLKCNVGYQIHVSKRGCDATNICTFSKFKYF